MYTKEGSVIADFDGPSWTTSTRSGYATEMALVVSAGLVIYGCGSSNSLSAEASSSPSPTPTPSAAHIASVDACSLVSVDEASTLTKTTVTALSSAGGLCIYGSSDGKASILIFANAYPDATAANQVSPEQVAAQLNGSYAVANAKPLSGVGYKAVEYSLTGPQGAGTVIFGFKANVVFMIVVIPPPDSTAFETLVGTAAGRI